MKETRSAEVVVRRDIISITSSSKVRAVLTKTGTWCVSVLGATSVPIISTTGSLSTTGNSRFYSVSPEWVQSWLSGAKDLSDVAEGVTLEPLTMNVLSDERLFYGQTIVTPSREGTEDLGTEGRAYEH